MSFFDPPPPPPEPPVEPPQPPWIGPPGNELGVAVPLRYVLARTDDAAILLDGFVAYSSGVELQLTVKSRRKRRRESGEFHRMHEDVRFGFRFADGHKVTNIGRAARDEERSGPTLMPRGGHGGDCELSMRHWLWPLPPPGPLQAVVEWTAGGIAETEVEVDGAAILDAASRAEVLWPEDAAPGGGGGWVGFSSHTTRARDGGERDR